MTQAIASGRRLAFTGKGEVRIESFDFDPPAKDEVLVRTELSLMSTGTEGICFQRLFDPGTHWDNWVKYPFYPGYTSIGIVEAVGSEVTRLKPGDRVSFRIAHRSHGIVPENGCCLVPDNLPVEKAIWFSLAKIAFHGALAADYRLGDRVLVIGAGPIGQMSIRWAHAAGAASIVVVDGVEKRLRMAKLDDAVTSVPLPATEAREAILTANKGALPRVVVDTTGNASVFSAALGLAADRGTVVILGDTGSPRDQRLTSDVIGRGLKIIGAHDGHTTAQWNGSTIVSLFFDFVISGRFPMDGLNTHFFKPEQCVEAYETATHHRADTMGIIFDWRTR